MRMRKSSRTTITTMKTRVVAGVLMGLLASAGSAQAAVRYMTGNLGIITPSVQKNYARGPLKVSELVSTTGTNLAVGGGFTMFPQGKINSGHTLMSFPNFAIVVQNSFSFSTSRLNTEVFAANGGAAATGNISFCPPLSGTPLQGNLACAASSQAGSGNYLARIGIDQVRTIGGAPLANAFGGTMRMTRILFNTGLWFAIPPLLQLGDTTGIQRVTVQPNTNSDVWTPGQENFFYQNDPNLKGPGYDVRLTNEPPPPATPANPTPIDPQGKIASFVAGPFSPLPATRPDDKGWGFRATTGIVSASDNYPPGFFYVTTGKDTVTTMGEVRNIVLIAGSIVTSSGGPFLSLFNYVNRMEFKMVPEPATVGSLAAGAIGLVLLAGVRRRI